MLPDTDIVIGFRSVGMFRTEEFLETCVNAVEQFTPTSHRWLFIDDNSDEHGARFVDAVAGRFRDSVLIRTHAQNWFTRAHNKGLRLVRTRRAVILNSDTIVGDHWLEELYDVWDDVEIQRRRPVGMVGSVYNTDVPDRYRVTTIPHYVTMHCALIDMVKCFEVAEKRGTPGEIFDTTSPLMIHIRSDVELSHSLNKLGYETVESFKSPVGHHGGKSWGHMLGTIPSDLRPVNGL
jgi:hypothetical protein